MRDTKRLRVTTTLANLTMLTPFTQYSVEVAAVNVRSHDGKVLEGQRSTAIVANTAEDGKFVLYATCVFRHCSQNFNYGVCLIDLFQKRLQLWKTLNWKRPKRLESIERSTFSLWKNRRTTACAYSVVCFLLV